MKVKELKRTVNVSWSPEEHYPVLLATGSAAQQIDASFNSTSQLELYSLNLEDPGCDLELKSSIQTQHKFQKLVWSGAGVIVGGCDGGLLQFYSAEKLLNNASDPLLGSSSKHNGQVSALDINPYQKNLLASGASDSEIFIWDLNNTSQPMAPGNRSQPHDHVQAVAWNQQVQHILGSTFATRCVVWDLRKNEPIMKLSDSQSRSRWRALAWHPAVATQLCVASEDDQAPVVQLWDLRLAASPLVTLERQQLGLLALSWCRQDPDLLLTAGKDGAVRIYNPNNTKPGGELLMEVSRQQQWVFDVAWCPRDPNLVVSASFDSQLAVHSLYGGSRPETRSTEQSNIMESFGGAESFLQLPSVARAPHPAPPAPPTPTLPRPPRWMAKPAPATFAFGGKLVTYERCPQETGTRNIIHISQVVSEPEIVERAAELDAVLALDDSDVSRLAEYCRSRGDAAPVQSERYTWYFLRANFLTDFRGEALNLLGFKQDDIPSKIKAANVEVTQNDTAALSRGESTETEAELSTDTSTDISDAHTLIERKLANLDLGPTINNLVIPNGDDSTSLICRAVVSGNIEEAVELCLDAKRVADAMIIASLGGAELASKVQQWHLQQSGDAVSAVAGCVLLQRWELLVRGAAPAAWRQVLAALLAHCDRQLPHWAEALGDKLSMESDEALSEAATVCYLCAMSAATLARRWSAAAPRDAAALAALTERAILLRKAATVRGRPVQNAGPLEAVVRQFACRVAEQGCLLSARRLLLGGGSADLLHLLQRALGEGEGDREHTQATSQPANRSRTTSTHSQRRFAPHADINTYHQQHSGLPTYDPPQPAHYPPQPLQTLQPLQPLQPPQPVQPLQPPQPPQPSQPPRPGSVGPQPGGLTTRSKYKVDPSVQSAPLYNQYSFNQPVSQAQTYGYNSPIPDQYSAASVPSFTPINPVNPVNPMNPPNAVNGGYYTPQQPVEQPAPVQTKPVAPGWNDPPMVSSKPKHIEHADMSALHAGTRRWGHIIELRRMAEPKQEAPAQPQAPITHPLFGAEPPQHVPLAPAQYPGQQYQGQQYQGQQYQGQQYPGQQYQGQQHQGQQDQQYGQYQTAQAAYPQQAESPAPVPVPATAPVPVPVPVPKPPLSGPLSALQTTLDELRSRCADRASNPQMKRKLEDVQRRLETLYDLIRENRLSESALSSLGACGRLAGEGQYGAAVEAATALAAGADFAAAAGFLPALRTLLQLGHQLQQRT